MSLKWSWPCISTLLSTATVLLCSGVSASNSELANIQFENYSKFLNDVSIRRSRTVFTSYSISPFRGVQQCFVHVGDGTAAFSRTDLVVDAPLPISVRRAYSSDRDTSKSFGATGWRLTIDETITLHESGGFSYEYGNGRTILLQESAGQVQPLDRATSDVNLAILNTDNSTATITTRAGLRKHFIRYHSVYRLEKVEDSYGNHIRLLRNGHGRIQRIVSNSGQSIELTVDSAGRLLRAIDSRGIGVSYNYSESGQLTSFVDKRGETWVHSYSHNGQLGEITAPNGLVDVALSYDEQGRVVQSTLNGRGCALDYGVHTRVSDPRGNTLYAHHPSGLMAFIENNIQTKTEMTLDPLGRPSTLSRNGKLLGTLVYRNPAQGGGLKAYHGSYQGNRLVTEFDELGRATHHSIGDAIVFDAQYGHGLTPRRIESEDRPSVIVEHNSNGTLARVSDGAGNDLRFARQGNHWRILREHDQRSIDIRLDAVGQVMQVETNPGRSIGYSFDEAGFRESSDVSDGGSVSYHYDTAGSLFYTVAGYENYPNTSFSYFTNESNLVSEVRASSGETHKMHYNAAGQPERFHSPLFPDLTMHYDSLGRLKTIERESLPAITYNYSEGEPDVVRQHDNRSARTSQYLERPEFGSRFEMTLGRIEGARIGHFRFDESVMELKSPVATTDWTPAAHFLDTVEALEFDALLAEEPNFWEFSVPSNRLFVPKELWAVNCCWCGCPVNTPYSCDTQ